MMKIVQIFVCISESPNFTLAEFFFYYFVPIVPLYFNAVVVFVKKTFIQIGSGHTVRTK